MDISSAFISDEQAPVSMEPGKGSLNNPAVLSKMRGTVHPTSGNAVLYMSHCARLSAKRKIVPFISVKFLRTTSGSPVQISQGRQMIQHIFQHFAIIHIGGSEADNKRNAIAIRYEMMFAFQDDLDLRGWVLCVRPPFCLDDRAVNTGSAPVDLFCIVQILQDDMVKALPNTSFLPVSKSAPAGHATAAAHLLWQVFPRYPCLEYKDNSGQSCRSGIRGRPPLGVGLCFGKKRFNLTPQFVAYQFPGHLLHPHWYFTAYSSICQVLLGALRPASVRRSIPTSSSIKTSHR